MGDTLRKRTILRVIDARRKMRERELTDVPSRRADLRLGQRVPAS